MYDQTKKSSHVHNIRKFMSFKNDAVVRTMSALEFDFASTLNITQTLKSIFHNQLILSYCFKEISCRNTPDSSVIGNDDKDVLIEVKHSGQISKLDFKAQFAEKKRYARENYGNCLQLITEKQIQLTPILNNLKLLHRYSGLHTITKAEKYVLSYIKRKQKVQLYDILEALGLHQQWLSPAKLLLAV